MLSYCLPTQKEAIERGERTINNFYFQHSRGGEEEDIELVNKKDTEKSKTLFTQ